MGEEAGSQPVRSEGVEERASKRSSPRPLPCSFEAASLDVERRCGLRLTRLRHHFNHVRFPDSARSWVSARRITTRPYPYQFLKYKEWTRSNGKFSAASIRGFYPLSIKVILQLPTPCSPGLHLYSTLLKRSRL